MSRFVKFAVCAAAVPLLGMAAVPATAVAQSSPSVEASLRASGWKLDSFYAARDYRPLWIDQGAASPAALRLIEVLRLADLDGMHSGPRLADELEDKIAGAASGEPDAVAEAELGLSNAWVEYVRTLRRPVNIGMTYVDHVLVPAAPTPAEILKAAADATSLERHVQTVSSLNPLYAQLREALVALRQRAGEFPAGDDAVIERRLKLNMDRARVLPAARTGKYIVVDAASQRLFMYEDGEVAGSMDVIVGKTEEPTPMLAALVRHSVVNPYWNVPPDLVRERIAYHVLREGPSYLRKKGYEVLSGWSEDAEVLDPTKVDWQAVADGQAQVRVRQLPGPENVMGDIKFMFPNSFGVYLHDFPDKSLFARDERTLSSGCVRLADAPRLARWLYGSMPKGEPGSVEEAVPLGDPVPVYITYLTADWDGERLAFRDDFYGLDRASGDRLASSGRGAAH